MKKTAFNLNLIIISCFASLAFLAFITKTELLTAFFTVCTIVFLILLPSCSRTK